MYLRGSLRSGSCSTCQQKLYLEAALQYMSLYMIITFLFLESPFVILYANDNKNVGTQCIIVLNRNISSTQILISLFIGLQISFDKKLNKLQI